MTVPFARGRRGLRRTMRAFTAGAGALACLALGLSGTAAAASGRAPAVPAQTRIPYTRLAGGKAPQAAPFARYDASHDSKLPAAGSATVTLPAPGTSARAVRAGRLPILVAPAVAHGTPSAPAAPGGVAVKLTDQQTAQALGVHGIVFSLTPSTTTNAAKDSGPVTVSVDDSGFAYAFGGDYAARLHLVRLPACALTTPGLAACQVQTPLAPAGGSPLAATVQFASTGQAIVFAATSGSGGSSGTYAATSLSPAGTWTAGSSSGSFDYSYPIRVPAAIGGQSPSVDLVYDSSAQDGFTEGTNDQTSWVGDGWSSTENYIERTYESCSDDSSSGAPQYDGDLCWAGQVLTLELDGQSTEIVYDDAKHTFHPVNDAADISITQLKTCVNGTYDNECWEVVENGIQYYFGLNRLPGWTSGKTQTSSAWSVPVYCANTSVTCSSSTFASSSELEGWRWNLDYVVDLQGNASAYYYKTETNNYGADMKTTPVAYDRDGYLYRIDYGMTSSTVYSATAPEQIVFNTSERCISGTPAGNTCAASQFTLADAAYWPDVPIDQDCTTVNTTSCPNHSPTFWTRGRLTSIVTQIQVAGATKQVDEYDLTQSFPDGGDHAPTLWLDSIVHKGLDTLGGATTTAQDQPISFDPPLQLPNRVGTLPSLPLMYHDRIQDITTQTGAKITVTYYPATCTPANVPANPATNTGDCFPAYWTPPNVSSPELDWFQKYPVEQVETQDLNNENPDGSYPELLTHYSYGAAGWHYDDNETVKAKNRTYGQFRGYASVTQLTGDTSVFHLTDKVKVNDQRTMTTTRYFQGMSQDTPTGTGGSTVTLTSQDGKYSAEDLDALQGQEFESDTYTDATGSSVYSASVAIPQIIGPTATRARTGLPALTAQMVVTAHTYSRQAVSTGWRDTESDAFYNTALNQATTGLPVQVDDRGETADPHNIPQCAWTRYVENSAETLVLPAETIIADQDCDAAGATQTGPLIRDTRTSYDGHAFTWDGASPAGTAPTLGDATSVQAALSQTGGTTGFVTTETTGYDSYGRILTVTRTPDSTQPGGASIAQTTTKTYTPASGAVPTAESTQVEVTGGTTPTYQTSSQTYDAGRGLVTESVDAAGLKTDSTYDALGRVTATWLPNESKAASGPANFTYDYLVSQSGPTVVTTNTLQDGGGYTVSETLYDALMRERQTQQQTEGGSILVSDKQYNSLGAVVLTDNNYAVTGAPGSSLVSVASTSMPDTTITDYDGLARADLVTEEHDGAQSWTTTTAYAGDHTTVIPPTGGVSQTTYTNARGQQTALDQYTAAPTVTGTAAGGFSVAGGTTNQTSYSYLPTGQVGAITGPDNSTWTFGYDLLGRKTSQSDPDTGTTSYTYDDAGDLTSTTDARGDVLQFGYDLLGRKVTAVDVNDNNYKYASWLYDTLQAGRLTSSTRYTPQGNYTESVTGYTALGKPTGGKITLPTSEAPLATSYTTSYGYSTNQENLDTQTDPRVAGLAGESITYNYDALGSVTSMQGASVQVGPVSYSNYDDPLQLTLGPTGNQAWIGFSYDDQTHRLLNETVTRTQAPAPAVDSRTYTYDPAGNTTSITDQQSETGSTTTDTQCFQYDALDRLTQAWTDTGSATGPGVAGVGQCDDTAPTAATVSTGATAYWQQYSYDAIGDRQSETDHVLNGQSGSAGTTYTNGGTPASACADQAPGPHTLTSTASGTTPIASYCYDKAGDTVSSTPAGGSTQNLSWDDQGELSSISQGASTTSFVYDADGHELIRRDPGKTTLFDGDTEIVVNTSVTPHTLLGALRTYTIGGRAIAVNSSLPGGGLDYEITDPQGTGNLEMNTTTQAVSRIEYTPYGQVRGTIGAPWLDNTRAFLNKPLEAATGYVDMGARKYDPALGRFLSADPMLQAGLPQALAGYTYGGDNPFADSDPSGCLIDMPTDGGGGGSGGGGGGGGGSSTDEPSSYDDEPTTKEEFKWWEIWIPRHETAVKMVQDYLSTKYPDALVDVNVQITGGSSKGNNKTGWADIVMWTKDKVYVWEVKNGGGAAQAAGPAQLTRYVNKLQAMLTANGDSRKVYKGFNLGTTLGPTPNMGNPDEMITCRSAKDSDIKGTKTGAMAGIIVYNYEKVDPKKPTPDPVPNTVPQTEEQQQEDAAKQKARQSLRPGYIKVKPLWAPAPGLLGPANMGDGSVGAVPVLPILVGSGEVAGEEAGAAGAGEVIADIVIVLALA